MWVHERLFAPNLLSAFLDEAYADYAKISEIIDSLSLVIGS